MSISKYRFKGASADLAGQSYALDDELWLGRSEHCQIIINQAHVAERQARIYTANGEVIVEAQAGVQQDGLWVNGKAVARASLASGDEVRIGSSRLVFQAPGLRPASVLRETPPTRARWGWISIAVGVAVAAAAGATYWYGLWQWPV